ncbi:hypothetical protein CR513_37038, partial [Mucuna pruriens]
SSSNILYELDPEIDRTLRRLRKVRSTVVRNSGSSNSVSNFDNSVSTTNDSDFSKYISFKSRNQWRTMTKCSSCWPRRMCCTSLGESNIRNWNQLNMVLFNTWGDMKRMFLEKFFLTSRTMTIRKEICGIRQHSGETLHEY